MVKMYFPLSYTWVISKETLHETKQREHPNRLSKFIHVYSDVFTSLRMGNYSPNPRVPSFYFYCYVSSSTADICISFKNANYKFYFKNISYCSETFSDKFDFASCIRSDESLEIEITGIFTVESEEYPAIPRTNIIKDELWKNKNKDFNIIVIDEKKNEEKIQIHKEILMFQSPVFEGMFRSGLEEAKTNILKIIDFNYQTVKLAVEFFYSQEILDSTSFDDIFELHRFADKYVIDTLMDYITTFISYRLTPSNVFEISNLANASTSVKLQQTCDDFITAYTETRISINDPKIVKCEKTSIF